VAAILLAGSYRRLVRMALETPDRGTGQRAGFVWRLFAACSRRLALPPVQSAVAGFTIRTLTRSRPHLMLMAMYIGIGIGIVLVTLIPVIVARGTAALSTPNVAMLSVPLIMNFCVLGGLRVVIAIPADVGANWTFRVCGLDDQILQAIRGVRLAMLLLVVAPVGVASGVVGVVLWNASAAALYALLTAASGMFLLDVLLIGLRKIPFTCTYYPGRSRARTLWPVYIAAFGAYAFGLATLEAVAMERPHVLVATLAVVIVVAAGLGRLRRYDLQPPQKLTYAEVDPDAIFTGFRLSEGLAAESSPAPYVPSPPP
jgi:hypothetical protein